MTALLLYAHLAATLCLMMVDATLALTFNKRYRILKSLIKRTLWPPHAVFYLLLVWQATNGNKKARKLIQRMR